MVNSFYKKIKRNTLLKYSFVVILFFTGFFLPLVNAVDYSSTNFILRNPAITIAGGRSTATSFEFYSASGQNSPGQSSSSNFIYQSGILYYGNISVAPVESGGGSSGAAPIGTDLNTKVIFSGKSYPLLTVVLLKNAEIISTITADESGNFQIESGMLSSSDYIFSLYGRDFLGKSSRLIVFPLTLNSYETTNITGVLIPPTLSINKSSVKRGENISFFGQSFLNSSILISIKSSSENINFNTTSDSNGNYSYELNTDQLPFGQYQVFSEALIDGKKISSGFVNFSVGDETIEEGLDCKLLPDFNGDCLVNLVDFSILIYWFDSSEVPLKIDLNSDKKADLVDFSIMAYYWTG
ncbi:MAG: hypothetical protein FJZ43_02730 [Candidatus Staskawiczbacteria bacterium]|nr:hypothetical protein [Candidatus Staskawiczbacteria bacterium]